MADEESCKVVSIVPDALRPERVRVRVGDDVYVLDVTILVELGLREGQILSDESMTSLACEAAFSAAKERALHLLSQRAYTEKEIEDRLTRHEYDADCSRRVIAWLNELGYLDDEAYAHRWVDQRTQSKGFGPVRLRQELMRKGISQEIVEHALAQNDETEYEAIAYEQAKKRLLRQGETTLQEVRPRLYGFLQRRGFPSSIIGRVMRRLSDEFPA